MSSKLTRSQLVEKLNRLHRRAQRAEAAVEAMDKAALKKYSRSGGSIGRMLSQAYIASLTRQLGLALDRCRDCNGERSCDACREAAEWLL